jgi:translation initiation factor 1
VCQCPPPEQQVDGVPPEKRTAHITIEKRKKGKWVTAVKGLAAANLPELLTQLKSACGAGGTVKNNVIEVQGKHLDRVAEYLRDAGYRVKH